MNKKISLLFWCMGLALLAYLCLDNWSLRHAPLYKKFERQWAADVTNLEESHKLPKAWNEIRDLKVIGGTPETRQLLQRVAVPLKTNPNGKYAMDALIVLWEESGKLGALIQYNIEDIKTKNTVAEIGRTLILQGPAQ